MMLIVSSVVVVGVIIFLILWFTNQPVEVWGDWSECNKECGTGHQHKMCTTEKTMFHAAGDCGRKEQECNTHNCPIDGVLSDWSAWSGCPDKCFTQVSHSESRSRSYTEPQYLGKHPDGYTNLQETRDCAVKTPCNIFIKPSNFAISGTGSAKPALVTHDNGKSVTVRNTQSTHIYTISSSDLSSESIKEAVSFQDNRVSGALSYTFIAPRAGKYRVYLRYRTGSYRKSDSIYIKFDSTEHDWHLGRRGSFGTNAKDFTLTAGQHTLQIRKREAGVTINSVKIAFVE